MLVELILTAGTLTFAARVLGAYIAFPPQLVSGSPPPPAGGAGGTPRPKLSATVLAPCLAAVR